MIPHLAARTASVVRRSLLALALLAPAAPASAPRPDPSPTADGFAHEAAAQRFLARHGHADAGPDTLTIPDLVAQEFTPLRLGAIEVLIPRRSLSTPEERERFQGLCRRLLEAQALWLSWIAPAAKPDPQVEKDRKAVVKWIDGWDLDELAKTGAGEQSLDEALETDEAALAARARLADALAGGALVGGAREIEPVRVVLLPSRSDFVEMLCVVGYLRPDLKQYFWVQGIERWHEFRLTDSNLYALAMEYPPDGVTPSTYSDGKSMEEDNPLALEEQITQLSMNELLTRLYDEGLPPTLLHSLSINLVIEQFGEIDTRADGRLEGRSTSAREMFIPGGRSEGGILPANSADNRWRFDHGRGFFLRTLRQSQKEAQKEKDRSRVKHANFMLRSSDDVVRKLIHAPFFGPREPLAEPPPALEEDQSEFLRAYRCAFVHFLRNAGAKSKRDSPERFAAFLVAFGQEPRVEAFESTLQEVYEVPLSTEDLDKNCLEGRYLIWLSKQRS